MMRTVEDAVLLYILRDARVVHPDGTFDKHNRWWADETTEERPCCKRHAPSRKYPYRQMKHCRTLQHICILYGADYDEARKEVLKPHWRVLHELVRSAGRIQTPRYGRPTMRALASQFVDLLVRRANLFRKKALMQTIDWLAQYDPRAGTIDWDSAIAFAVMRCDDR